MHGSTLSGRLCLLLVALLFAGTSAAWGQPYLQPLPEPGYLAYTPVPDPGYSTEFSPESGYLGQASETLADRVAELEAEVRSLRESQLRAQPVNRTTVQEQGGLRIEKADIITKPTHKIRGRILFDHVMYDDDPVLGLDRENETGFDSARMGMEGRIFENVKYSIEVEFEGTEVDFKTVYAEVDHLPWLGAVRAGHFYEPIAGLDEVSGSKYQMFMERSIGITTFIPSRSFGCMVHNSVWDENLYWAVGTFRHESDDSPDRRGTVLGDRGDWVFTSRVAWNPYYDELSHGRYLCHLGLGYSYRTDTTVVEFDTISELGNQGGFLATTVPGDRDYSIFAPEFLVIWGRASVQSEFVFVPTGAADFWSGYVEASYFLTPGHRGYKRSTKELSDPVILEDFFSIRSPGGLCFGRGGWEVKTRWSYVDLLDGAGPDRGTQNNWSVGFNWYLNSYARIMFDYVYEDVNRLTAPDGQAHNFGTRLQVHW